MKTKDISQIVVGFLVMVSFMVVLWAVFKIEMPAPNRDLALILLGVLASKFGDVVAYHFNSSKGSSDKTDIISKLPPVSVLLIPLFLLASCAGPKQTTAIKEVPVQYKERIVERLVPKIIPADSSALFALFECDSTQKVILKQLNELKGKAQSNIGFQDGKLTYKLIYKHDTIWVKADTVYISKEVPVRVDVPVEVNRLTNWQTFWMMAGKIYTFIMLAYFLIKGAKYFLRSI